MKSEVGSMKYEVGFLTSYFLLLTSLFIVSACAKQPTKVAVPVPLPEVKMPADIVSFKGLAYIVAEKGGIKWANNVSVLIRMPSGLRLEAIERITDVVAMLVAKDGAGYLRLPLEDKTYPLKNSQVRLPKIGEISITTNELACILAGRPGVDKRFDDVEINPESRMPLVYTRYSSGDKKRVVYEANFDDFKTFGGRKFPQRIVLRFEHPKLLMEIRYKGIQLDAVVPWGLFEVGSKK